MTENHIRSGFVAMGILFAYWWQLKDLLGEDYSEQIESGAENINAGFETIQSNVQWMLILLAVFLVGAVMMSVGRIVFRHYGFHASMKGKSLHVESGLFRRNEYSIPLSKIQMLVWQGNFLRRIPGFESVIIKQSKSEDSTRKLNVEIPSIYEEQSSEFLNAVFHARSSDDLPKFRPHAFYAFYLGAQYLLIGLFLISIAYLNLQSLWVLLIAGFYSVLVIFYARQYFKRVVLRTDGELVEFKRGWLFNDRILLRSFKLQSVKMKQSIFQKRRGTAHLILYTAGGSLRLPFMPEKLVHEMYDYFLYKIETSKEAWM